MSNNEKPKILVAITGASGTVCALDFLDLCREESIETHLIISKSGILTAKHETEYSLDDIKAKADFHYSVHDIGAACASGSMVFDAMVIVPCSMKTLGEVAHAISSNLISRAAEVQLKERRRLILVAREAPLSLQHCRNFVLATENGAIIMPPVPAFYQMPKSIQDIIRDMNYRILNLCRFRPKRQKIWQGL